MNMSSVRNEINLREAMCVRMIKRHEQPERIYEVRKPLAKLYKRLLWEEKICLMQRRSKTD